MWAVVRFYGAGGAQRAGSRLEDGTLSPLFALEGGSVTRGELHRFREVHGGISLSSIPFDIRRSSMALFIAEVLYA